MAGLFAACKEENAVTDGAGSYWDQFLDQNGGVDDGTTDNNNDDPGTDENDDQDADTGDDQGNDEGSDGNDDTGGGSTNAEPTITARSKVELGEGQTEDIKLSNNLKNYYAEYEWQFQVISGGGNAKIEWKDDNKKTIKITGLIVGNASVKILAMSADETLLAEKIIPITVTDNSPIEATPILSQMLVGASDQVKLTRLKGSIDIKWKSVTSDPSAGLGLTITDDEHLNIEAKAVGDYKITITGHDNILNRDFNGTHDLKVAYDFAINSYELNLANSTIKQWTNTAPIKFGNALALVVDSLDVVEYTCAMKKDDGCNVLITNKNMQIGGKTVACIVQPTDANIGATCSGEIIIDINGKYGTAPEIVSHSNVVFNGDPCSGPLKIKILPQIKDDGVATYSVREEPQYLGQQNTGALKDPPGFMFTEEEINGVKYLATESNGLNARRNGVYKVIFEAPRGDGCEADANALVWEQVGTADGVKIEFVSPEEVDSPYVYGGGGKSRRGYGHNAMDARKFAKGVIFTFKNEFSTGPISVKLKVSNATQSSELYTFNFNINKCRLWDVNGENIKIFPEFGSGETDTSKSSYANFYLEIGSKTAVSKTHDHIDGHNGNGKIDNVSPNYIVTIQKPFTPMDNNNDSPTGRMSDSPICLEDIYRFNFSFGDFYNGGPGTGPWPDVHVYSFLAAACEIDNQLDNVEHIINIGGHAGTSTCLFAAWQGDIGGDDIWLSDYWERDFQIDSSPMNPSDPLSKRCSDRWCSYVPFGMDPGSWGDNDDWPQD